jgi:hypothetical protein
VAIGGPAPTPAGARYAELTLDGQSRRLVLSQGLVSELDLPFDKFREPRLLEYGRSELSKIELGSGAAKVQLDLGEQGAFYTLASGEHELANRNTIERVLTALARLATEQFVEIADAKRALGAAANVLVLAVKDHAIKPITLSFGASCPKEPALALALVLREQDGHASRAGCIPQDVATALHVGGDDVRLRRPFSARTDEVEELRVSRGSQKLELARKDKAFVLRGPSSADVPLDAGNARISAIIEARGEAVPSPSLKDLGLEPAAGELSIQLASADEASHRSEKVAVGTPRPDGRVCVKRDADGVVLCFSAETAHAFEPDATLLKGLGLLGFAPSELASFSVVAPDLRESVRRNDDGSYDLIEPKGYLHDGSLVADAVQTLGTLQAARWVSGADNARFGLAEPRLRVTVTLKSGVSRELAVGAATEGGFFARLGPDPGVFVLARSAFSDLSTPLIDRALCPLAKSEIAKITLKIGSRSSSIERRGEAWDGAAVSSARAGELAETLSALRADFTVHLGAAKANEALAKPNLVVELSNGAGKSYRLRVGARDTLNDSPIAYARLDGVDATFALSQRTVQSLQDF